MLSRDDIDCNKARYPLPANAFGKSREYFTYKHNPLSIACLCGNLNIVKMLKEDGRADFNKKIKENNVKISLFRIACFSKNRKLVEYFLSFPEINKDYNVHIFFLFQKFNFTH